VSRSYFTRVVRLSYLAPDITQAILDGRQPRDLRYRIDFIKVIFHPIRRHRSETVLNGRGVDFCPPASRGPAASASIGGEMKSDRSTIDRLLEAKRKTDGLPLFIDDPPAHTVAALRSRARRLKRRRGLDLIVADYLQLIQPTRVDGFHGGQQNRVQEVSEITRRLKALAKELDRNIAPIARGHRLVWGVD